jgi:hypothetical protein
VRLKRDDECTGITLAVSIIPLLVVMKTGAEAIIQVTFGGVLGASRL